MLQIAHYAVTGCTILSRLKFNLHILRVDQISPLLPRTISVCMYERIYNALNSNSLSRHECAPVGQTEKMCL